MTEIDHLTARPSEVLPPALPEFITFTGADDNTDPAGMVLLADDYPIEWGLLFSPKRQGAGRYPPMRTIEWLVEELPLRWSAHLCGGAAREVMLTGKSRFDHLLHHFERAQVNTAAHVDPGAIKEWADRVDVFPILQCRASFPLDDRVLWLFDKSGGRGIEQTIWPQPLLGGFCGYAGGLNAGNVANAIRSMSAGGGRYWIDMESGVRDERDRFSLDKCRAVCEAVYGRADSRS